MMQTAKIVMLFVLSTFVFSSCYDEYRFDYEYSAVYFAIQDPLRTVVVEDGYDLGIEIGVVLAGKYYNEKTETVQYEIAPELLNDYPQLKLLPTNYYELSNENSIDIPVNRFLGTIDLTLKNEFVNDEHAHELYYALPLKIINSSTDSILGGKDYTIIAVKFQNKYYGSYWIKGVDYTLDENSNPTEEYVYSDADLVKNNYAVLSTLSENKVLAPYAGFDISGGSSFQISINESGEVSLEDAEASAISSLSGTGRYDSENKTFYLDYGYQKDGVSHHVVDTLIYFAKPMELERWQ